MSRSLTFHELIPVMKAEAIARLQRMAEDLTRRTGNTLPGWNARYAAERCKFLLTRAGNGIWDVWPADKRVTSVFQIIELKVVCAWCGVDLNSASPGAHVSHGICDPCCAEFLANCRRDEKNQKDQSAERSKAA